MGECNEKDCPMKNRIERLEESVQKANDEVSDLKIQHAETKVYVKQILEQIADLKALIVNKTSGSDKAKNELSPIVMELIKLVSTTITILAAIAGYAKIVGN